MSATARRAFPVVYATDVAASARFWERLGFTQFVQLPAEGDPGYVGLRRDGAELAVTARGSRCSSTPTTSTR